MANLSASGDIDAAEEELALAQRRCAELKAATEKPSEKVRLNLADAKAVKEARVKKTAKKTAKKDQIAQSKEPSILPVDWPIPTQLAKIPRLPHRTCQYYWCYSPDSP
ncbi:hypothetical protein V8E54_005452 [Elaphomyces granulatus]